MKRALFSRLAILRRVFARQPKRLASGGHHEVVNPGPPVTLDYMPVPFQPYQKVYNELQAKFNTYLAVSTMFLAASFGLALYYDIFIIEALSKPKSYRNRHKN
ncbi:hypothetical protein KIN20_004615 [Parelaphostrongylus tenuis]|uniref:Deltamethrin resistance protein prag01 domain-containing protein n=1 Tax=Parelaphostrongylus tenuis TaxID=148309 RepID=A0AAD5QF99_PARTN|nr:hypothetical protein KIN20_004615 [Parelaphostrongylus tenuis]